MRLFILIMGLVVIGAGAVHAQETAPDDPCDPAEEHFIRQVGGPETSGVVHLMRCDGTAWRQLMTFLANGSVGFGRTDPDSGLHVRNNIRAGGAGINGRFQIIDNATIRWTFLADGALTLEHNSGSGQDFIFGGNGIQVGIGNPSPQAELDVAGNIFYTGVSRDQSDRRQKNDIRPIGPSVDKLRRIEGVSFVMKDDPDRERELGVIAQDVKAVYPDLVATMDNGTLALNYNGLIAPLIEAVKELDDQDAQIIERLEAENAELRRMVHALAARMDVIEGTRRPPLKPYNP